MEPLALLETVAGSLPRLPLHQPHALLDRRRLARLDEPLRSHDGSLISAQGPAERVVCDDVQLVRRYLVRIGLPQQGAAIGEHAALLTN